MATSILSNRPQSIEQSTLNTRPEPEKPALVSSYELLLCSFLPDLSEAICRVREVSTGAIHYALASNLLPFSYGKDAYLLELMRTGGNDR